MSGHYPDNWDQIALDVKTRNGWRCERCKHPDPPGQKWRRGHGTCDALCCHRTRDEAPDGSTVDTRQRVLTVHHLDGNKSNCADWNLAALCQVCHLQIQHKVKMEQGFLFPEHHSDWFLPHLEGFLDARRSGDLVRDPC